MNKRNKLVFGVGVNDFNGNIIVKGEVLLSYSRWAAMLGRCYSNKVQAKQPTYLECSVCDEWLSFSNFKIWFDENYVEGFALDKDILIEGNKIYSPEACRFVPQYLNNLLNDHRNSRGSLPLGISKTKHLTYMAQCCVLNGESIKKTFKTIEEAKEWYSETKKSIVKQQAQRAFLDNAIKTDVYLALVRREF